jgi:hypothetical protein
MLSAHSVTELGAVRGPAPSLELTNMRGGGDPSCSCAPPSNADTCGCDRNRSLESPVTLGIVERGSTSSVHHTWLRRFAGTGIDSDLSDLDDLQLHSPWQPRLPLAQEPLAFTIPGTATTLASHHVQSSAQPEEEKRNDKETKRRARILMEWRQENGGKPGEDGEFHGDDTCAIAAEWLSKNEIVKLDKSDLDFLKECYAEAGLYKKGKGSQLVYPEGNRKAWVKCNYLLLKRKLPGGGGAAGETPGGRKPPSRPGAKPRTAREYAHRVYAAYAFAGTFGPFMMGGTARHPHKVCENIKKKLKGGAATLAILPEPNLNSDGHDVQLKDLECPPNSGAGAKATATIVDPDKPGQPTKITIDIRTGGISGGGYGGQYASSITTVSPR